MSYNASFVSALKEALNGLKTVHQVGEEWVSYVGDIPAGGVPYCGQEVNRSTYSALWEYANAKGLVKSESEWQSLYNAQGGNVAFYSSGNGSSTFRMPRLVGYVRGASSQSESGSYVKEGLPNITGTLYGARSSAGKNASYEGGLTWDTLSETNPNQTVSKTDYSYGSTARLDASKSNSIYGNSSHVTPETSVVLYGVYAFGEVTNVSSIDIGTVASSFAALESNVGSKLTSLESNVDSKLNGVVRSVNGTEADANGNVALTVEHDTYSSNQGKYHSKNTTATYTYTIPNNSRGTVTAGTANYSETSCTVTLYKNDVQIGKKTGQGASVTTGVTVLKKGDVYKATCLVGFNGSTESNSSWLKVSADIYTVVADYA